MGKRTNRKPEVRGKQRRLLVEKVRRLIGKNYSDNEVCDTLQIRPDMLQTLKSEIIEYDRMTFEHLDSGFVYSDYLMKARSMISRLQQLQNKFKNRGQWTALVAAIKQEKEIYDKCISLGQDFGFIEKKVQQLEVAGEFTFGNMTDDEVKNEIQREVKQLNALAKGKIVDMRPELLGVTADEVQSYVPAGIANIPKMKRKVKVKTKVKLTRRG